jgi:hypothetical protein
MFLRKWMAACISIFFPSDQRGNVQISSCWSGGYARHEDIPHVVERSYRHEGSIYSAFALWCYGNDRVYIVRHVAMNCLPYDFRMYKWPSYKLTLNTGYRPYWCRCGVRKISQNAWRNFQQHAVRRGVLGRRKCRCRNAILDVMLNHVTYTMISYD